jgi:hypothetical protein
VAGSPPLADKQTPNPAASSTVIIGEPAIAEVEEVLGVNEEEKLPANIALAKDRLNKAREELKKKIPADIIETCTNFEIRASVDLNCLAHNIGSALVMMMQKQKIRELKHTSHALDLVKEWAKKTIPFVETGLNLASVP